MAAWLVAPAARAQPAPAASAPAASTPAGSARDTAVKAAFLYKFASFVEWPPGTFATATQPLVIGVMGNDGVASDLEQVVQGRTVDGRPLVVRRLPDNSTAIAGVHVLFIGSRRDARLKDAINAAAGPVLIVTEQPGALAVGSVLNFVEDEGHVRFAASLLSADARKLKLSARLLAVAQDVEGRAR